MAVRPQCNRIAVSFNDESAYGSVIADASIMKRINPREPVILTPSQERTYNESIIKGTEFATDPENRAILVSQDIDIPFTFDAGLSTLGWCIALAFGGIMTTAVPTTVPPAALAYRHEFWAADLCMATQYPSTSLVLGFIGALESNLLVKGVLINELRIAISEPGIIELSGTIFTDGTMTKKMAFVFPMDEMNVPSEFLTNLHCDFLIADKGSADVTVNGIAKTASVGRKLRGFELGINNNLDREDARGQLTTRALTLSSLNPGDREYTLSVTVEGHQGDELWEDWITNKAKSIELTAIKTPVVAMGVDMGMGGRLMRIRANDTVIENITDIGFDGIRDRYTLNFKLFAGNVATYRAGLSGIAPIFVELRNGDATYFTVTA